MPAVSAMRASARFSAQLPVQRSGTVVTARPDEQFGPNSPICSALPLYMARRSRSKALSESTGVSGMELLRGRRIERRLHACHDLGRGRCELAHELLQRLAGHRQDLELELVGLGE